jgi:hypothetical protein
MTTVTASTSLILVTTSNLVGSTIVAFPNISTTGRIITVRDNDGFASSSNYIILNATAGASFGGVSGSLIINQPFGFITLLSQASGNYAVLNTFAFPTGSTAAFVSNITANNIASLSTMQLQDRATSNLATMYVSGGQIILNQNFIGQITSNQLQSTVTHLGSLGYLSTVPLFASTQSISSLQTNFLSAGTLTVGVFNPANITTTTLTATTGNFRTVSTGALLTSSIQYRSDRIAIGSNAGTLQTQHAIAIGTQAASIGSAQGSAAIAIGQTAGYESQKTGAIAIGQTAGLDNQNAYAVAIGSFAGRSIQGDAATAIGYETGYQSQGQSAVAIGPYAGRNTQGNFSVAVGLFAGQTNQGLNAVAIGAYAGSNNQSTNTIILNATGAALNTPLSNATFIKPIRQDLALNTTKGQLYYTSTTGELTYGPTLISTFSTVITSILNVLSNTTLGTSLTQISYDGNGYNSIEHKGPAGSYMDFGTPTKDYDLRIGYFPSSVGYAHIQTKSDSSASTIALMPKEGTGRVGINTTSPQYTLDVAGNMQITRASESIFTLYRNQNTANFSAGILFNLNNSANSATLYGVQYGGIQTNTAGSEAGFMSFNVRYPGNTGLTGAGFNQTLVLYSNNVGINFTQGSYPSYNLDVNGRFRVASNANNFTTLSYGSGYGTMELKGDNGAYIDIGRSNVDFDLRIIYQSPNGYAEMRTNAVASNIVLNPNGGSGRVGINTISPAYALDVNGSAQIGQARISTSAPNSGFALTWNQVQAGAILGQTELISGRGGGTAGGFDFFVNVANNTSAVAADLAVRITGDKKVGINTDSPAYTLDVSGTVRQQGMTSVSGVVFLNNSTGGSVVFTAAKRGVVTYAITSENGGWQYGLVGISYNSGTTTWNYNAFSVAGTTPVWTISATAGGVTFAPYNNTGTNQNIYYSISWTTSQS